MRVFRASPQKGGQPQMRQWQAILPASVLGVVPSHGKRDHSKIRPKHEGKFKLITYSYTSSYDWVHIEPSFSQLRSDSRRHCMTAVASNLQVICYYLQTCQSSAPYQRDTRIHITKLPMMIPTRILSTRKFPGSFLPASLSKHSTMQYKFADKFLVPAAPSIQGRT